MKKVLIIILNYKTYKMTINLIQELNALDKTLFDIMVVDNCSPNESAKVLKEYSKQNDIIFYQNNQNSGYAAGNNIGIRYGINNGYQYSLIMNNDIKIADPYFIQKLLEVGEKDDNIACIGPKIIDLEGIPVPPYCNRPSFFSLTFGLKKERHLCAKYTDKSRNVYRLFGCCMLVKNDAMKKVDCMDERTFLFCEEEILAERLLRYELTSYYCADTSVIHLESSTIKREGNRLSKNRIEPIMYSMKIYLKDYRRFNFIQVKMCQLVRLLIILLRG